MVEYHGVLGQRATPARAAEAGIVADHGLQLQRDVLDDVRRIGAAVEALDEAAAMSDAALMLNQPRGVPPPAVR